MIFYERDNFIPDADEDIYPPSPGGAPGTPTNPLPPERPDERRGNVVGGFIVPGYQSILGRDPNEAEINEGYALYEAQGGDAFRDSLRSRLGGGAVASTQRGGFGDFIPPAFDYPEFRAPAPFEYDPFVGPTKDTFQADPGYDFRVSEGNRALVNDASASGLRRSGGFLKDLATWREGLASQEFGNVFNRQYQTWKTNLDAKAQNYERDWRSSLTDYTLGYQREADEYSRALSTHGMNADVYGMNFGNLLNLYNIAMRSLPNYTPIAAPPGSNN